jgi:glutamate racemase
VYLERHGDFPIGHRGARRFLTSGVPGDASPLLQAYWGGPLRFEPLPERAV